MQRNEIETQFIHIQTTFEPISLQEDISSLRVTVASADQPSIFAFLDSLTANFACPERNF